jgi:hypothetical protein
MLRIKVKHLKQIGMVSVLVVVIALSIVSFVTAQSDITVTVYINQLRTQEPIYDDQNNNGIHEDNELIGFFDVHDGNEIIEVVWNAYPFEAGTNGSYKVFLRQYQPPNFVEFTDIKGSHHWASGQDFEEFTFGSFGFGEDVCQNCPTAVMVEPETYELVIDTNTGGGEYIYTPVVGAPAYESRQFVIEIFRPYSCDIFDIGPCIHPQGEESFWQKYYVPDLDICGCNCTLTNDMCKNDIGIGNTADPWQCICVFK